MKTLLCGFLLIAAGIGGRASAGVIFNWHQLSASPTVSSSSGWLEITDAAWHDGHIGVDLHCSMDSACYSDPSVSPVLGFTLWVDEFDYAPVLITPDLESFAHMTADMDISNQGKLTGWISAITFQSQVDMAGGAVWSIGRWRSDAGCWFGENGEQSCAGATGEWVLDPASLQVPGPDPLPLFVLGLIGVWWVARRRKAAD